MPALPSGHCDSETTPGSELCLCPPTAPVGFPALFWETLKGDGAQGDPGVVPQELGQCWPGKRQQNSDSGLG